MRIFGKLKNEGRQVVTRGRFEIERNGAVAFLEYALAGTILELIHTENKGRLAPSFVILPAT